MLKKAGIVVAAAAAGLLAVSPLAFAGDKDGHHEWDRGNGHEQSQNHGDFEDNTINNAEGDESKGIINVADNNVNVPIQVCNTDVPILAVDVEDIAGALGLLGDAAASSGDEGGQRTCEADAEVGDEEPVLQSIED
ncbi:hypothetical protein [Pseudonocardia nigra]|uniref:hypothetical protein n=1 Tax=Pseudonocardia nigra TaxID=1921578 RepID=UPI001C5ED75B|nr:hypothetical protein [Pseudonocardia nigra]